MTPPKLTDLSFEDYIAIKKSGMFWEYYPEATGIYYEDVQQPNLNKPKGTVLTNEKHQWTEDGRTCKAVVKGSTIKIKAVSGYCIKGNLLKLKDTGTGFIAKFPSHNLHQRQDNYICMDYSEADYLYKALQVWFEQERM